MANNNNNNNNNCNAKNGPNGPNGPNGNTRGTVTDTPEKFEVSVSVPEYRPNQLCVRVNDDNVEVKGEKDVGGKKECFSEKYPLPCDVDKCTIKWEYGDCKLVITAEKKKPCP